MEVLRAAATKDWLHYYYLLPTKFITPNTLSHATCAQKVRKTPSRPRSWTNFSLL